MRRPSDKPLYYENNYPFQFFRTGRIVPSGRTVKRDGTGKVAIQWLDQGGGEEDVLLLFPQVGNGWGVQSIPEENSIVLVGFYQSGVPVVLGYLPLNYPNMVRDAAKPGLFWRLRRVKSGEYSIKSKQQAEIYLDENGSLQLIVRDQTQGTCEEYTEYDADGNAHKTYMPQEALVTLKFDTVGTDTVGLTTKSGAVMKIDSEGNAEVSVPAGKAITLKGSTINLNESGKEVARKGDGVSGETELTISSHPDTGHKHSVIITKVTIAEGSATVKAGD